MSATPGGGEAAVHACEHHVPGTASNVAPSPGIHCVTEFRAARAEQVVDALVVHVLVAQARRHGPAAEMKLFCTKPEYAVTLPVSLPSPKPAFGRCPAPREVGAVAVRLYAVLVLVVERTPASVRCPRRKGRASHRDRGSTPRSQYWRSRPSFRSGVEVGHAGAGRVVRSFGRGGVARLRTVGGECRSSRRYW